MAEYAGRSEGYIKKREYGKKLKALLADSSKIFIVGVDNVGSKQMQQIRIALRGVATIVMGKNTTIRKVFREFLKENEGHPAEGLLPHIAGNVGLVFTDGDLVEVRDKITENRSPAPARIGAIAPLEVIVPPGPTGCDPGQTAWFQALQIPTKINRGQIEIINEVSLIKEGEKVGNSEAALLQKLDINPFTYGMEITCVYDNGEIFDPQVLDLTDDDLCDRLRSGIRAVAAISLELGYPTLASLPHSLSTAFKHLVAVALETDYSFEKADAWKEFIANPGAFGGGGGGGGDAAAAAAPAEEEKEEEEEESAGGAGGLFEDDDDDW